MRVLLLISLALLTSFQHAKAQFSATDMRKTSGSGPFPIYGNAQWMFPGAGNLFSNFVDDYTSVRGGNVHDYLHGFELNVGIVINDHHFLGLKNLKIRGLSVEAGYRYLFRNIHTDFAQRLHLQEESVSIRLGYRICILYPVTAQIQTGPTIYNFLSVNEINDQTGETLRYRDGYGTFERINSRKDFPCGWEIRGRIMLFDPAGTEGGLGFYIEYRYLWTRLSRNLSGLYETIIPVIPISVTSQSWDYGMLSLGVVVPFAKRIVSNE